MPHTNPRLARGRRVLFVCMAAAWACAAIAGDEDAAVASVNGKPVSRAQVDFIVKEQVRQGRKPSAEMLKGAREEAIRREALAQEARRKLGDPAQLRARLEFMRNTALINALREDFFLNARPGEDEIKQAYEQAKTGIGDRELLARHILVDSEAAAKRLIERLQKGESFDDLARVHSLDASTAAEGGSFGWAAPGNFPPEFSAAVEKLAKGRFGASPVKTAVGWHVVRLDEIRTVKPPAFEEARPRLAERIIEARWRQYIADVQARAQVR